MFVTFLYTFTSCFTLIYSHANQLPNKHIVHVFYCLFIYMYCCFRFSYQEGMVGTPCHTFVPVPSQDLDFQRHMLWLFVLLILVELMTIIV